MSSTLCATCGNTVTNDIKLPTTPVPDILGTNHLAPASQTRIICDTISAAQADISQLDVEIIRLRAVLDGLMHKREALHTYTHQHMALVAPVRRLPPEILSEIFIQCKDTKWFDPLYGVLDTPRLDMAPLLLGSVCRRWRMIALSTPRLWASVGLTIRPKYLKSDVLLVKTWLARAGTCPLSIALGSSGSYSNDMRSLMKVFLLHCERWYDVRLSLPLSVLGSLSPARNRLASLQKLGIYESFNEIVDVFECAPQLRSVYLPFNNRTLMIKVPWNQLQHFDLGGKVDKCLELLRLAPNLKTCRLRLFFFQVSQTNPPVQLSHLRHITIRGSPAHIFNMLLLPKLHEICIDIEHYSWTTAPQFTSLLSQCSLECLSFSADVYNVSDDDMIQILLACSSLVQLRLRNHGTRCMTKSFLAQFAHDQASESSKMLLVPRLHTIIVDYTPQWFDIFDFADAIQSRMMLFDGEQAPDDTSFARLEAVEINYFGARESLNTKTLSRLRYLRDTGLKISLLQGPKDLLI
jgi:hypothetical protein